MDNFTLHNPTKIIFGKGSVSKIAEEFNKFGKKVLVTYGGGSIKKNGLYDKVMSELKGFEVREFGGIEPNPRVETIRRAIDEFKSFDPDFVLAIGGGSVVDGSKLLVSAMHYNGDAWDFMIKQNIQPTKYIPLGVILTISATGTEMNCGAVITNWTNHEKLFFERTECYPKFSVLDPENTFTVPADQTAYGVIDAYSHVLEQYINTAQNVPLQDRLSESILLTLIENAPLALKTPSDYNARANIMLSACLALNGLIQSGTKQDWATHNIEHEISAFYDIPHAAGLAIITPRWMKVVLTQKLKKLAHYGRKIWALSGDDDQAVATQAIQKTYDFFKSLGVKMSLSEWGIPAEHFPEMVSRLAPKGIGEIALTGEQIGEILNNCLS